MQRCPRPLAPPRRLPCGITELTTLGRVPLRQPPNQPIHSGDRGRQRTHPGRPIGLDRPPQGVEPRGHASRVTEQHGGAHDRRGGRIRWPDLMPGAPVVADGHVVAAGPPTPRTMPLVGRERTWQQRVAALLPALVVGVTQIARCRGPLASCRRTSAWADALLRPRPLRERSRRSHPAGAEPARVVPTAEVPARDRASASLNPADDRARLPDDLRQEAGLGTIHGCAEVSPPGPSRLLVVTVTPALRACQPITAPDRAGRARPGLPVRHPSAAL